jgi:hypothetical protein
MATCLRRFCRSMVAGPYGVLLWCSLQCLSCSPPPVSGRYGKPCSSPSVCRSFMASLMVNQGSLGNWFSNTNKGFSSYCRARLLNSQARISRHRSALSVRFQWAPERGVLGADLENRQAGLQYSLGFPRLGLLCLCHHCQLVCARQKCY